MNKLSSTFSKGFAAATGSTKIKQFYFNEELSTINTFDFDGVIYMGTSLTGVRPCEDDIIITGRPYEEAKFVFDVLAERDINNYVFFNPVPRSDTLYSRKTSGHHKAKVLLMLRKQYNVGVHFEDDRVQSKVILEQIPDLQIIHIDHGELIEY